MGTFTCPVHIYKLTSNIWSQQWRPSWPKARLCGWTSWTNIPTAFPPMVLIPRLRLGELFLNDRTLAASHAVSLALKEVIKLLIYSNKIDWSCSLKSVYSKIEYIGASIWKVSIHFLQIKACSRIKISKKTC